MAKVAFKDNEFVVSTEPWDKERAKQMPERKWFGKDKVWIGPAIAANARYIETTFTKDEIEAPAKAKILELKAAAKPKKSTMPPWYNYKGEPMEHQKNACDKAFGRDYFGFFHDMGTGKTFTNINLASAWAMDGQIDGCAIVCPTSIKDVWAREIEQWSPIPTQVFVLNAGDKKGAEKFLCQPKEEGLKWFIVGVEALSQGGAKKLLERFLLAHRSFMGVDESSRIKNFKATRTEEVVRLGGLAYKRSIMTGTPITQGLHDIFSQLQFLHWEIIGQKSFYAFRNRYCVLGGFENRAIVGYQNVPELMELVQPHVDVCKITDVIDMPERTYEQRLVKPSKAQLTAFVELHDMMMTESEGDVLETETILERLTRYQQIAGGNFPYANDEGDGYLTRPITGKNPKLEELLEVLNEIDGKVIIWARFVPEIEQIRESLVKVFGIDAVTDFYGGTVDRSASNERFRTDPRCRFMVSNQVVGGMGQTWVEAQYAIYYSNSFSYEDRRQSERRNWRKGQDRAVVYIDLTLDHRVDQMITAALLKKQSMAEYVDNELSAEDKANLI